MCGNALDDRRPGRVALRRATSRIPVRHNATRGPPLPAGPASHSTQLAADYRAAAALRPTCTSPPPSASVGAAWRSAPGLVSYTTSPVTWFHTRTRI
jgi:hypothetical protein